MAEGFRVEAGVRRLVGELLDTGMSKHRPPLTSDVEHARTIDPVLTEGATIWIHEALPNPPLTVIGGRVFTYRDVPYDPLDAPVLKIRPIDDDQLIPFLVRVVLPDPSRLPKGATVNISFPTPNIFDAHLENLSAWVGSDRVQASIERSYEHARIEIRVPLPLEVLYDRRQPAAPITVIVAGKLGLAAYKTMPPGQFADSEAQPVEPALAALAHLEVGRDVADPDEIIRLRQVAENLVSPSATDYQRALAVNSWVSTLLRYRESPATRSPTEILQDQSGDCDDYVALALALLRALGVAARPATGLLYDLNTLAAHAWLEVALPTRDGTRHWFIVDPTLAGTTPLENRKASYVQYRQRILFYPIKPTIALEGMAGHLTVDVLLNWLASSAIPATEPSQLRGIVDLGTTGVDQNLSRGAERLAESGLTLRRESASIAGSPYLVVDRPLVASHSSRLQLRLENEERLVLELTPRNGSALESEIDIETISEMRAAYSDLNRHFFVGAPAHHNLELAFKRDRHSDRLRSVSLRFGRYLIEHHLDRILTRLAKGRLLTDEETAFIASVGEASGGKNLYVLQELSRRLPDGDSVGSGAD